MKITILHTDPAHQPVAAAVAEDLHCALPPGTAGLNCAADSAPGDADLILAVFSLRPGAFAPIVPGYRDLRDRKVAFLALLVGPVDASRLRKTIWGIKKQFCGNRVVGGYLCPADDQAGRGLADDERAKALAFVRRLYEEQADEPVSPPIVVPLGRGAVHDEFTPAHRPSGARDVAAPAS